MTDKVVWTDTNGSHRETGTRVVWTDSGSHRETVSVGGGGGGTAPLSNRLQSNRLNRTSRIAA